MKTIKILYGGDAMNKEELAIGDVLVINHLEEAISFLGNNFKKIYLEIPKEQLINLKMIDCSLMFFNIFNKINIKILTNQGKIQRTIVKNQYKQVKIFTSRD